MVDLFQYAMSEYECKMCDPYADEDRYFELGENIDEDEEEEE